MDKIWDRKSFEVGGHWPLWNFSANTRLCPLLKYGQWLLPLWVVKVVYLQITACSLSKYLTFSKFGLNNRLHSHEYLRLIKNWMTTCLRSCELNASGDAANPLSALALHDKFASVTNRVHITWTQTGRHSILIFTFSPTIYVKCKFFK